MNQNPEQRVEATMQRMPEYEFSRRKKASGLLALGAAVYVLFSTPAQPAEFEKGDLSLSLDTTVSYGLTYRLNDRDPRLIGLANGGSAFSVNADDGNLNYDTGLVSNLPRIISELELKYGNFGAFVRASGF